MTRTLKVTTMLVVFLLSLVLTIPKAAAFALPDQANTNYLTTYWIIKNHQAMGQVFTPTKNRLDAVGLKLAGNGASANIRLIILDLTDVSQVADMTITIPSAAGWRYFDFPTDIVIAHPNSMYGMYISTPSANAYWADSTDVYPNNKGYEIVNGDAWFDYDFGFITYGYDYTEPPAPGVEATPPADDGVVPTEQTSVVPDNPAITPPADTSTTISAPTSVTAADVPNDNGEAIKISWKASSSTDITGYKVFRSAEEKKGFASVGTVDKAILEYTDSTVEYGKTYYYYVRAYKDSSQSSSSNTVSAASVNDLAPAAPVNFSIKKQNEIYVEFTWDPNSDKDLAGYILKIYKEGAKIDDAAVKPIVSLDIAKEVNGNLIKFASYPDLVATNKYDYYLVAKDTANNLSTPTKAVDKTNVKEDSDSADSTFFTRNNIILGVGGLLILVLAGILIWQIIIHKKKIKAIAPPAPPATPAS